MIKLQAIQDNFRYRLAHADALPQLAILGILSGLLTSLVAIAFRLSIELPLAAGLPEGSESFEQLPRSLRFLLPVAGFTLLGIVGWLFKPEYRSSGVAQVINRLHHHQAKLAGKNMLFQFIGGVIAMISGAPLGREGPAIHLGAAASSLLGQKLKLPNNSLRILVACGVAAAIAASFNTPLAGVVFAMEVVLMEYTIVGFIPVIIASVVGAVCSRLAFGTDPAFAIPPTSLSSLLELPYFALCGVVLGIASAVMLSLFQRVRHLAKKPFMVNYIAAGLLTGVIALFFPQVMGVGYDTVEQAMLGQIAFITLLAIVACKIFSATTVAALGIPGGLIGPTFVIGACLGAALGVLGGQLNPTDSGASSFYAILGMGAMMGAVLNAPLAALIAVLELTYNPNILLPSMLVIVIACMTSRRLTHLPGIFAIGQNIDHYASPVFQALNRAGVTSIMATHVSSQPHIITWQKSQQLLEEKFDWFVIEELGQTKFILRPVDLARFLTSQDKALWGKNHEIDLMEIPGERRQLTAIHPQATLQEALVQMKQYNLKAVYVRQASSPLQSEAAGIITREAIDNYYQ